MYWQCCCLLFWHLPISFLPTSKGEFSIVTMHQRGEAPDRKVLNICRRRVNEAVGQTPCLGVCQPIRWLRHTDQRIC